MSPFLTEGTTSSGETEYETPDYLFERYNRLWEFSLDGAASELNTKLDRWCSLAGTYERQTMVHPDDGERPRIASIENVIKIDDRDGLTYPWEGHCVYLNPPWGPGLEACNPDHDKCRRKVCADRGYHIDTREPGLPDFLQKVVHEHLRYRVPVLAVLPARTDNAWFHDYVKPFAREIEYERGRVPFLDPVTKEPAKQPPVGIIIAHFR